MGGGRGEMCDYCFTCDSPGEDSPLEPLDAALDLRKAWVRMGECVCVFVCACALWVYHTHGITTMYMYTQTQSHKFAKNKHTRVNTDAAYRPGDEEPEGE